MKASYDNFAKEYSDSHGEKGDYYHRTQIDPYTYKIIGNPKGKAIYDLGCGNGYMARNLAKKGAKVIASDISSKLIIIAKEKSKNLNIKYLVRDGVDFTGFKGRQFDVVVVSMVINYINNIDKLFSGVSRVLKNNGLLIIATNHFLKPAYPYSEWVEGKLNGSKKLFIKVTDYLEDIKFKVKSGWDNKTMLTLINRPLGRYVNSLAKHNLFINNVFEPESVGFAKDFSEELQKSHHIPTFIIFSAIKKE